MKTMHKNIIPRLLGAAIATAALITPGLASAQDYMSYNSDANQQISGTIDAINGTWNITVHDSNGYADSVELHQGTIIYPTGLTLEPGMNVTIDGYADGPNFQAMEIDTPYQYQGPAPVAVYYGPGAWYPGYATGWGPSFSLFFDFDNRRFERRSFAFNGRIRRPEEPPSGWEDRPHGYIGRAPQPQSRNYNTSYAPQQRRNYEPQQLQQRYYAPQQQQQRNYAPQQQQQRNYAPQQQQQRDFAPQQQQQRQFAAPPQQQQRQFAAPPQQQARQYTAPPQQQQRQSAPQARQAAPEADRSDVGRLHHGG